MSKIDEIFTFQEVSKTEERIAFEKEYQCYIYTTREENKFGYNIDCVYFGQKKDIPQKILSTVYSLKLHSRFNMGQTRGVWLPKSFELKREVDHIKDLLNKYSFKL